MKSEPNILIPVAALALMVTANIQAQNPVLNADRSSPGRFASLTNERKPEAAGLLLPRVTSAARRELGAGPADVLVKPGSDKHASNTKRYI